jgi:hypothetical protein
MAAMRRRGRTKDLPTTGRADAPALLLHTRPALLLLHGGRYCLPTLLLAYVAATQVPAAGHLDELAGVGVDIVPLGGDDEGFGDVGPSDLRGPVETVDGEVVAATLGEMDGEPDGVGGGVDAGDVGVVAGPAGAESSPCSSASGMRKMATAAAAASSGPRARMRRWSTCSARSRSCAPLR